MRVKACGDDMQDSKQDSKPKFIFTCQRCGRCCERDVKIYLNDIERWSKDGTVYQVFPHLTVSGESMALSLHLEREDGKCRMYDPASKECKIYDNRPQVCRAYPLMHDGSGFLLSDKECPGLNKGEMSKEALEEIKKAAVEEHVDEGRTAVVLPMVQVLLLSDMAKKSEEAFSRLTNEEKAKLEEILKKDK
jgi:Fe-S-cluster containining protein